MTLLQYYLQFVAEICEGARPLPDGITLTQTDEMRRAVELQSQIQAMGIPAFVRRCAEASGIEIPEAEYEHFDLSQLTQALSQLTAQQNAAPEAAETPQEAPEEPVRSEIRDIYEVFLDSVCLEDDLLLYLIDVLKRRDAEAFRTLSHAAARTILDMDDFLAWLGNKELLAPVEEGACARIMDACLERLCGEERMELLAALLAGDQKTFELFRCEAPELQHLPDATYEWFSKYYLDRYYPVRFMMKYRGIEFPKAE